ncbi:MAG TPA: substrate-binding domain-containing protein [Candidatus Binataceae bacterium]|nr:substrate-binding domain-containing protein [Candidatus Binataceae bacterium]
MAKTETSKIKAARAAAGVSQAELAQRAGISRQALGAIEAGTYQPGVTVAIALAREVGQSVEALFGSGPVYTLESATWIGDKVHRVANPGERVALSRVNGRIIATPLQNPALKLAPATGVIKSASGARVTVESFRSREEIGSTLAIAGCDPGVSILSEWLARRRPPIEVVTLSCSSRSAIQALNAGRVHVAGIHLRDPGSGEYNVRPARSVYHRPAEFVTFACWEIGIAVKSGSPAPIERIDDLARPGIRIVNREIGSGARLAMDDALRNIGLKGSEIAGYDRTLGGHLEVAAAIAAGEAEAGPTIRVASETYGLGFIPIREERYDLVVPRREMESEPVRAMLDALNSSRFARELAELCSYDTRRTGAIVDSPDARR